MYLTASSHIGKGNHDKVDLLVLRKLAYHAARLYNVGLYNVRQHYFNTGLYLKYEGNYHESCSNENYRMMVSDTAQLILRLVDRNMKSFFSLLKAKEDGKYSFPVHLPRYKDKEGIMAFTVQGRSCRVQKDGTVAVGLTKEFREAYNIPYKRMFFTIPKHIRHIPEFKEMRFIPLHHGEEFRVEFVYDENLVKPEPVSGDGYMSIDMGVDNLMACAVFSNGGSCQFLIDGRPLKSINRYYNKTKAHLQEAYATNKSIVGMTTARFRRLSNGRDFRINDYFNKAVMAVIRQCIEHGISTIVVGYNREMKQEVSMGKVNNQTFVSIPYYKLRQKLAAKCALYGIRYYSQEESYTSKASALDGDDIPVFDKTGKVDNSGVVFSGKRVKRGLYRSMDGKVLNADINGAVNILRKYLKECNLNDIESNRIRALVNAPCLRINALHQSLTQAPLLREVGVIDDL